MCEKDFTRSSMSILGNFTFASISRQIRSIKKNQIKFFFSDGHKIHGTIYRPGKCLFINKYFSKFSRNLQSTRHWRIFCVCIFFQEKLSGIHFFSGLIPRWLLEIATIVISNVLIHLLKSQLPTQNELVPMYEYMAAVCTIKLIFQ